MTQHDETPERIGQNIADAGALIGEEAKAVASVAARAIRAERKGAVRLTKAEAKAALAAISNMTDGNARDFGEWRQSTSGTAAEWRALLRAEAKLETLMRGRR